MKTPNNKSWIDKFDSIVHYEDGLYTTESGWRIKVDPKKIKDFISQLLQQERKAERERVMRKFTELATEICTNNANVHACGLNLHNNEETKNAIITKLNQLKEE